MKAFKRITVPKDSSVTVELAVPVCLLSYWNETEQSFFVEGTGIEIQLGNSSANILLRDTITITAGGKVRLVPGPDTPPTLLTQHSGTFDAKVLYPDGNPILEITLARKSDVNISQYDIKGIMLNRISNQNLPAGKHEILLNSGFTAPGLYIIRGYINQDAFVKKFIVK